MPASTDELHTSYFCNKKFCLPCHYLVCWWWARVLKRNIIGKPLISNTLFGRFNFWRIFHQKYLKGQGIDIGTPVMVPNGETVMGKEAELEWTRTLHADLLSLQFISSSSSVDPPDWKNVSSLRPLKNLTYCWYHYTYFIGVRIYEHIIPFQKMGLCFIIRLPAAVPVELSILKNRNRY